MSTRTRPSVSGDDRLTDGKQQGAPGRTIPTASAPGRAEFRLIMTSGMIQGTAIGSFPAASSILLGQHGFGLSTAQYGLLFAPQVVTAIPAALLGGTLSRRFGTKTIFLVGLLADLVALALFAVGALTIGHAAAYPLLLVATAFVGAGFGLAVPALNVLVVGLRPRTADQGVLLLNAMLGVGTALAPLLVALFVGLDFWWGLPLSVVAALAALLIIGHRLPLRVTPPTSSHARKSAVPARFWLFAGVAVLYGVCETISGNWAGPTMSTQFHANATLAAVALSAFWAAMTAGRLLFAAMEKIVPARWIFRLTPVLAVAAYGAIGLLPDPTPALGVGLFAIAGLGCAAVLPSTISFGQADLTQMRGSADGALIAFYQIGYATATFSIAPLVASGFDVNTIFAAAAAAAVAMMAGIFWITRTSRQV